MIVFLRARIAISDEHPGTSGRISGKTSDASAGANFGASEPKGGGPLAPGEFEVQYVPVTHPVEDDPELAERLKAAQQAERVAREVDELRQRVGSRGQSIARDFDRVLAVLQRWGYVQGWELTDAGKAWAEAMPFSRNGHSGYQVLWNPAVVEQLKEVA